MNLGRKMEEGVGDAEGRGKKVHHKRDGEQKTWF